MRENGELPVHQQFLNQLEKQLQLDRQSPYLIFDSSGLCPSCCIILMTHADDTITTLIETINYRQLEEIMPNVQQWWGQNLYVSLSFISPATAALVFKRLQLPPVMFGRKFHHHDLFFSKAWRLQASRNSGFVIRIVCTILNRFWFHRRGGVNFY